MPNWKLWLSKSYVRDSVICLGFAFLLNHSLRTQNWLYFIVALALAAVFLIADTTER